jgi:hypothetical protein
MARGKKVAALALGVAIGFAAVSKFSGLTFTDRSNRARVGMTAKWERQLRELAEKTTGRPATPKADRRVAEEGPRCLRDRLAAANLRQEVAQLESAFTVKGIDAAWDTRTGAKLADFAQTALAKKALTLPPAQTQFIYQNAFWIPDNIAGMDACQELPCILNLASGLAEDAEDGWRIYAFWLRSNYVVSVRPHVPGDLKKGFYSKLEFPWAPLPASHRAYYFEASHLLGFLKLSYLAPEFMKLSSLQSFHHVPPIPPDLAEPLKNDPIGWGSSTCADCYGGEKFGVIRARRCIEEARTRLDYYDDSQDVPDNGIRGNFYFTMLHEMAHARDHVLTGDFNKAMEGYSLHDQWLSLSLRKEITKSSREEYRKNHDGADCTQDSRVRECVEFNYVYVEGREKPARWYGHTSPAEDFADSAAYVRFRPEIASEKIPERTASLSTLLFGGRTFDAAGLGSYYENYATSKIIPDLLKIVDSCVTQSATAKPGEPTRDGAAHFGFDRPLPQALVACLESDVNRRATAAFDELRRVEWEACDQLETRGAEILARVFARLNPEVSRMVNENVDRMPVIRALEELRLALDSQIDAREAYVHCRLQAEPEGCFNQAMADGFDRVSAPFADRVGAEASTERASFLGRTTFGSAASAADQFYHGVLLGTEPSVRASADTRWEACLSTPPLAAEPSTLLVQPYTGGTVFVAAHILNCINGELEGDIRAIRDTQLKRLGLSMTDGDAQTLMQDLMRPIYLEALRSKQDAASSNETRELARRKPGVLEVMGTELTNDASWMGNASTREGAAANCQPVAEQVFSKYFSRVSSDQQLQARFNSIDDLRVEWANDACLNTVARKKFSDLIDQNSQKAWTAAMASLEAIVAVRAKDIATDCRAQYKLTVRQRACLTLKRTWDGLESEALAEWSQTAVGKAYASRRKDATAYLKAERVRLQNSAISVMQRGK